MSIKYALLGILAEKPRHGYELKRTFDERLGDFWSLNFGQIYTTLERLRADGLVECAAIAQTDRPDKKIYRVTQAGLEDFQDWRVRPIKAEPRALRDELFLKLMFMSEDEFEPVLQLIQTQQSVYMAHMMQLTDRKYQIEQNARRGLDSAADEIERRRIVHERLIGSLLIDVALQHAEADIRWLRQCQTKITSLYRKESS
jgi:DNA-binding PadR family transcriptional regulator